MSHGEFSSLRCRCASALREESCKPLGPSARRWPGDPGSFHAGRSKTPLPSGEGFGVRERRVSATLAGRFLGLGRSPRPLAYGDLLLPYYHAPMDLLTVRLPDELHAALTGEAHRCDVTRSSLVREIENALVHAPDPVSPCCAWPAGTPPPNPPCGTISADERPPRRRRKLSMDVRGTLSCVSGRTPRGHDADGSARR